MREHLLHATTAIRKWMRPLGHGWPAGSGGAELIALAAAYWTGLVLLSVWPVIAGPTMTGMAMDGEPHADGHPHSAAMFAACWALMVGAMMAPLAIPLAEHLAARWFRERRTRAVALAIGAFLAVWISAGAVARADRVAYALERRGHALGGHGRASGRRCLAAAPSAGAFVPTLPEWDQPRTSRAAGGPRLPGTGMRAALAKTCFPMMITIMLGPMRLAQMATLATIMLWERRRSAALGPRGTVGACLVLALASLGYTPWFRGQFAVIGLAQPCLSRPEIPLWQARDAAADRDVLRRIQSSRQCIAEDWTQVRSARGPIVPRRYPPD